MKIRYIIILLFIIHNSLFNAFGADTTKVKTFSLKEAEDYAIKNSYQTKNAAYDIDKARKMLNQTAAIGLPQINAGLKYSDMFNVTGYVNPNFIIPEINGLFNMEGYPPKTPTTQLSGQSSALALGTQYDGEGTLTASQLLFDGSYFVGVQAAKMYVELSKKSLAKSEADVREAVAQAYYLALVAVENKIIIDSTLETVKSTLTQTQEFLKNGFVEETDVDQVQLLYSDLENKQNMISKQIDITGNLLKFQMGININEQIILTDKLIDIVNSALGQNLNEQEFNFNKHINYMLLLDNENLDRLNLRRDRYGYLPSLACFFALSKDIYSTNFVFTGSNEAWYKTICFGA